MIGEAAAKSPQQEASIFSLPAASKDDSTRPRTKPSKRMPSKAQHSQELPTLNPISTPSPLKPARSRQLSVPPSSPSLPLRTRLTSRKASAPARVSVSRRATVAPRLPDPPCHVTPAAPPPPSSTPTTNTLATYSYPGPSTPLEYPQSPLDSPFDRTSHWSYPITGPTTPPALLPDLFSEPVVVTSTPVHPPGSSLMPITDPFLQFQPQYDYLMDPSRIYLFDYGGSTPGFATGGFFPKTAFDTPPTSDHLPQCIQTPISTNPFDNNFPNTHAVS